jgi:hypothetical protein
VPIKKKKLSKVCLSKRNILLHSSFLCVFWRYTAEWTDEGDRDRQTNRLTVCVVHIQKYKVLSTSTKLTLHMQLCSQRNLNSDQMQTAMTVLTSPSRQILRQYFYIKPWLIPFQILANSLATSQPIMLVLYNFSR